MKYTIEIEEVLRRSVSVEAANEAEARKVVEGMYRDGEIVLDAEDFCGEAEFRLVLGEAVENG